jgi:hypothetical protein
VARQIARRITRLLEPRELHPGADPGDADPLPREQPLLASLSAASVSGRVATGRRAGRRVLRVGDRIDPEALPALQGERCASVDGVSLHANVAMPARDRRRLERLCRYVARPPVAADRLSRLEDGRLLYRLKHRWRDGTSHVVFEPRELVEKLAALVPPPGFHTARYHGILGPCASARHRVVPGALEPAAPPALTACAAHTGRDYADPGRRPVARLLAGDARADPAALETSTASAASGDTNLPASAPARRLPPPSEDRARPRRLAWADLLRRVFALDVLRCPGCGGRLRILAAVHPPEASQAILVCLALPVRAPPIAPARRKDEGAVDAWADSVEAPPTDDFGA